MIRKFDLTAWIKLGCLVYALAIVSELSAQESVRNLRGVVWEDSRYNALPLKLNFGELNYADLPENVNLKKFVPRVINQGPFNMAASWATIWYAASVLEAQHCGWEDGSLRDQGEFSPFFNYFQLQEKDDPQCAGPVSMIDMMESFKKDGVPRFADFKDVCADNVSEDITKKSTENKITGYVRLFNSYDAADVKVHAVKLALRNFSPVVVGMACPASFVQAESFWSPKEKADANGGGHALCVIAYDDSKYGGAFQVVNSWGKSWGNQGFTWIQYADFADFVKYGFEMLWEGASPCNGAVVDGYVRFLTGENTEFETAYEDQGRYRLIKQLPTGTQFRVESGSKEAAYLYTYYIGPDNEIVPLFPDGQGKVFPATGNSLGSLVLPSKSQYFTLEDPPGKNRFVFVYSKEELDINYLSKNINMRDDGSVSLIGPLSLSFVPTDNVRWKEDQVSFTTKSSDKTIRMVTVEIDQVGGN